LNKKELHIYIQNVKTLSFNTWKKRHKDCYTKTIKAVDEGTILKAKHCLYHNELFILDMKGAKK